LPLVYEELRKLAAAKLAKEKPGQTLVATALVHEAYLRLVGKEPRTEEPKNQEPKKKYKESKFQIKNTKSKISKGHRISDTL